jgi:hypothetical protein
MDSQDLDSTGVLAESRRGRAHLQLAGVGPPFFVLGPPAGKLSSMPLQNFLPKRFFVSSAEAASGRTT